MSKKLIGGLLAGTVLIGLVGSGDDTKTTQNAKDSNAPVSSYTETKNQNLSFTATESSEEFVLLSPSPSPSLAPTSTPKPAISTPKPTPTLAPTATSGDGWDCNCRKTCDEMSSCAEAQYQLNTCGCGRRDADNDGIACDADCQ